MKVLQRGVGRHAAHKQKTDSGQAFRSRRLKRCQRGHVHRAYRENVNFHNPQIVSITGIN